MFQLGLTYYFSPKVTHILYLPTKPQISILQVFYSYNLGLKNNNQQSRCHQSFLVLQYHNSTMIEVGLVLFIWCWEINMIFHFLSF
jgi:hypothetical protein